MAYVRGVVCTVKVAVYLSGLPKKSKNEFKKMILNAWCTGVQQCGDQVVQVEDNRIVNCDVAVIQGYVHEHGKQAPHLQIRRNAIVHQKQQGKHALIIDSNLYQFLDMTNINKYLRYSVGGIFPTDAWYFEKNMDMSRWNTIKADYGFEERKYSNKEEGPILICLQRNGGWSMGGIPAQQWITKTIAKIRRTTTRPIVVRGHPGDKHTLNNLLVDMFAQVTKQTPEEITLRKQLARSWCTVTYNSSPGVASLLYGTPVFVTDPIPKRSQCFPICNTDLNNIESPNAYDRTDWYHKLAQFHWTTEEVRSGQAWRFMRDRLPT